MTTRRARGAQTPGPSHWSGPDRERLVLAAGVPVPDIAGDVVVRPGNVAVGVRGSAGVVAGVSRLATAARVARSADLGNTVDSSGVDETGGHSPCAGTFATPLDARRSPDRAARRAGRYAEDVPRELLSPKGLPERPIPLGHPCLRTMGDVKRWRPATALFTIPLRAGPISYRAQNRSEEDGEGDRSQLRFAEGDQPKESRRRREGNA